MPSMNVAPLKIVETPARFRPSQCLMRSFYFVFLFGLAVLSPRAGLSAAIEKKAVLTDKGMELYWWPKVAPPSGWHHDDAMSVEMQSNVLVPKGKTFRNAETVIYARAFYQPDKKKRGTLQEFIDEDIKNMLGQDSAIKTKEIGVRKTAKGNALRTYSFTNRGKSYEQVCYGGEGDFWIEFVVSSQTQKELDQTLPIFKKMVGSYH